MYKYPICFLLLIAAVSCNKGTPDQSTSTPVPSTPSGPMVTTYVSARFNGPAGVAADAAGNLYVADEGQRLIRKIDINGVVTTLAGGTVSPTQGYASIDGTGTSAGFADPTGLAVDATGNIYVSDNGPLACIRKVTPAGVVTTIKGFDFPTINNGAQHTNKTYVPEAIAVDGSGNIYIGDDANKLILKVTPAGVMSTIAGNGTQGSVNGPGVSASFYSTRALCVDAAGNIYVSDSVAQLIRKINTSGVVSTFAGTGTIGATNGTAATASFNFPGGIAVDAAGNLYVSDQTNNLIRKITVTGIVSTLAGTGAIGANNGPAASATFYYPESITVDAKGTVYVGDGYNGNGLIRKITQ